MLCTHFPLQNWIKRPLKCDECLGCGRSPQLPWRCKCEPEAAVWCPRGVGMELCGLWEMIVHVCVWGEGELMYQSHSDTLSKALCVGTSEREQLWASARIMHDRGHMPRWSPKLPSAPVLSSQAARDKVAAAQSTYWWGLGFESRSHVLLIIRKPFRKTDPKAAQALSLQCSWVSCFNWVEKSLDASLSGTHSCTVWKQGQPENKPVFFFFL